MKRIIHEEANREFREALLHYVEISPRLGARFYLELERVMHEVCAQPELFRPFDPPARRHIADGFPYAVIYLARPDDVWIVAVMHLHRKPGYWRERLG